MVWYNMTGRVTFTLKAHTIILLLERKSTLVLTGVKFSSVSAYMKFVTSYGMIMSFSLICVN